MFEWTQERIAYMDDACRRTDFHQRLAAELSPYLRRTNRICDAGCGLGYLSLALAPYVGAVMAVERDGQALAVLKREIETRHIANVTAVRGDVLAYRPDEPFDAMVFCFFGSMEEMLATAAGAAGARCWRWFGTMKATAFPASTASRDGTAMKQPAVSWMKREFALQQERRRLTSTSRSAAWRTPAGSLSCTAETRTGAPGWWRQATRNFPGSCPAAGSSA